MKLITQQDASGRFYAFRMVPTNQIDSWGNPVMRQVRYRVPASKIKIETLHQDDPFLGIPGLREQMVNQR